MCKLKIIIKENIHWVLVFLEIIMKEAGYFVYISVVLGF